MDLLTEIFRSTPQHGAAQSMFLVIWHSFRRLMFFMMTLCALALACCDQAVQEPKANMQSTVESKEILKKVGDHATSPGGTLQEIIRRGEVRVSM
jgi:hypothetical protein